MSRRAFWAAIRRLQFLEAGLALFEFGFGDLVPLAIIARPLHVTTELLAPNLQLLQHVALFRIILLRQNLSSLDHLALAETQLKNPPALKRDDLCPALRFHRARSIDRFGHGCDKGRAGFHGRRIQEGPVVHVDVSAGGDQNPGSQRPTEAPYARGHDSSEPV